MSTRPSFFIKRANKLNISFEITKDEFKFLITQPCYYCGDTESNCCWNKYSRKKNKNTTDKLLYNGLDRIDSNLGYTKENIVPCCAFCNLAKLDYSEEEFISKVIKIYENLHKKQRI